MKRTIKQNLESFNKIKILRYSKIINVFLKRQSKFSIIFLITSCSVQNEANKDDYRQINNSFSAKFYDKLDTINVKYDNSFYTRSFIKEFTNNDNVDYSRPINIQIIGDVMYLQFSEINKKDYVLKFFGKCSNKKFVFYTNYETITFPILFMTKQMSKYSIYLTDENEIIFKNHEVNEGMVLLFGAGTSSNKDYKFKLLKNE
jgi:hypothetical protein